MKQSQIIFIIVRYRLRFIIQYPIALAIIIMLINLNAAAACGRLQTCGHQPAESHPKGTTELRQATRGVPVNPRR